MSGTGRTGQPGRYSRSFGGLVGAMVVTVVGVLVVFGLRSLTSDDSAFEQQPVEYLGLVRDIQAAEAAVVYPRALPSGWAATDVDFRPGPDPAFSLSVLTEDNGYVGLRVEDASVEDLLESLVDEDYQDRDPLVLSGEDAEGVVATRWDGYGDEGGDSAYAAEVDGTQVLVYGSASPEELSAYVALLTEDPVTDAGSSDQERQPSG